MNDFKVKKALMRFFGTYQSLEFLRHHAKNKSLIHLAPPFIFLTFVGKNHKEYPSVVFCRLAGLLGSDRVALLRPNSTEV